MSTISTYLAGLAQRIADQEHKLDSDSLSACITQALKEYSARKPRYITEESTANGTAFLPLPASWDDGFSAVARLEEVDASGEPLLVEPQGYQLLQQPNPAADVIFLTRHTPQNDVVFRVKFPILHVVDDASSSIPAVDEAAVIDLAASHACLRLAAEYLQHENASLGTVQIDYKSKASEYRSQAKEYRNRYNDHLGALSKRAAGGMKASRR